MTSSNASSMFYHLKNWWINGDKTNEALNDLINGKVNVAGWNIFVQSGHRALVGAKKGNETFTIFDCGAPDTQTELQQCLRDKLEQEQEQYVKAGRSRTRRNRISRRGRKAKRHRRTRR